MKNNREFWEALDELAARSEIVIDRPKGTVHPKYPNFIYRVDYGYLKGTSSMDGAGIDVWVGSIVDLVFYNRLLRCFEKVVSCLSPAACEGM